MLHATFGLCMGGYWLQRGTSWFWDMPFWANLCFQKLAILGSYLCFRILSHKVRVWVVTFWHRCWQQSPFPISRRRCFKTFDESRIKGSFWKLIWQHHWKKIQLGGTPQGVHLKGLFLDLLIWKGFIEEEWTELPKSHEIQLPITLKFLKTQGDYFLDNSGKWNTIRTMASWKNNLYKALDIIGFQGASHHMPNKYHKWLPNLLVIMPL